MWGNVRAANPINTVLLIENVIWFSFIKNIKDMKNKMNVIIDIRLTEPKFVLFNDIKYFLILEIFRFEWRKQK